MKPSEYFDRPLRGRLVTKEITLPGEAGAPPEVLPSVEYEFLDVGTTGSGEKLYVCDEWRDEAAHEPQLIPGSLVERVVWYQDSSPGGASGMDDLLSPFRDPFS